MREHPDWTTPVADLYCAEAVELASTEGRKIVAESAQQEWLSFCTSQSPGGDRQQQDNAPYFVCALVFGSHLVSDFTLEIGGSPEAGR